VPDLNRAINKRGPAEREIADAEMREPRQAGGAWRDSSMTLGLKGKRERKALGLAASRRNSTPPLLSRAINNSCDPNVGSVTGRRAGRLNGLRSVSVEF
jgi:hypothetical protein